MNLFATVLTYTAPSSNYRGESEESRTVLQRITKGRFEYAIVSPEAIRNAIREQLRGYGLDCNRSRLDNEDQLAVRFEDFPHPDMYVDDFYFGYLVAQRKDIPTKVVKERSFQFKRDSVLRMNLAMALEPYRHDTVFTQSPLTVKNDAAPWQNSKSSALLHREVVTTPFQYPLAFNLGDTEIDVENAETRTRRRLWFRTVLRALSELTDVSGNHARSYFEFAPASIVLRLTNSLVAGYDTYGFQPDGSLPEIVNGILSGDFAGSEFHIGGRIVREVLSVDQQEELRKRGTHLYRMANQALNAVAAKTTGEGFLGATGGE